jgi:hypothetical protein
MQKVVGSSPIIRFAEKPRSGGVFCWGAGEGPLASNGRPAQKHAIRKALHPQFPSSVSGTGGWDRTAD